MAAGWSAAVPARQSAAPAPSAFPALETGRARFILLLAALCTLGVVRPMAQSWSAPSGLEQQAAAPAGDDLQLYRQIIDRLRAGESSYPATATLLRDNDYPLRPFITFRLPTLALLLAAMPGWLGTALLTCLCAATIFVWTVRLGKTGLAERPLMAASLLLLAGSIALAAPRLTPFHESWAALLIALSLALHRTDRWGPSVALALLALLIRELALPFVLLMGAAAPWQRRWREAGRWAFIVALFALALALHAHAVASVVLPGDPASPGWMTPGDWPRVLTALRDASILGALPVPTTALLAPLALLGCRGDPASRLAALYSAGFAVMMMLGRPQNYYWIAMIMPLFLAGLAFAPAALRDLVRAARAPDRSPLAKSRGNVT
ncbi:MAG TPA: hypothetical protein VNS79_08320 [Sphingobium sp.]|nr:hypothetical protein [Sphingobium sp.]